MRGSPVAQRDKRWPIDLGVPNSLRSQIHILVGRIICFTSVHMINIAKSHLY